MSIIEKALGVMKTREFVAVATADKGGKPNCAPKLLLKIDYYQAVNFIVSSFFFHKLLSLQNLRYWDQRDSRLIKT